jgi:hypothetical protein
VGGRETWYGTRAGTAGPRGRELADGSSSGSKRTAVGGGKRGAALGRELLGREGGSKRTAVGGGECSIVVGLELMA